MSSEYNEDALRAFIRSNNVVLKPGEDPFERFPDFRHFPFPQQRSASEFLVDPQDGARPTNPPTLSKGIQYSKAPTQAPVKVATRSPTDFLSPAPSSTPLTASPTLAPVKAPTPSPTQSPVLPTPTPSVSPTLRLTKSPSSPVTDVPTKTPPVTDAPTKTPPVTDAPTKTPPVTDAPTQTPTSSLIGTTPSPTSSSTGNQDCVLDKDGNFNTSFDGAFPHFVDYNYKIITNPSMSNKIQDEVLIHVENSVLNFILPEIMPVGRCADRRVLEASVTNSTISGASTIPADLISRDASCFADDAQYECNNIDGKMTVFTKSSTFDSVGDVHNSICNAMDQIDFTNNVHPAIVGVECIAFNDSPGTPGGTGGDGSGRAPEFQPVKQSIAAGPLVGGAIAAAMIVFGVYFYRRRQRKEDDDALAPVHMDDSDMKNPNSFSSSYDEGMLVNDWNRTGKPAMDFSTIVPRNGMNPETIEESVEEYLSEVASEKLEEISLDGLDMSVNLTGAS